MQNRDVFNLVSIWTMTARPDSETAETCLVQQPEKRTGQQKGKYHPRSGKEPDLFLIRRQLGLFADGFSRFGVWHP